ncbi:uncharacterized protein LOC143276547 isoform X2 [Babylonia areolata]|uniref:uncharacterized protein LOC143276547 isoform X2 n=1 Tax=Babylonia areolata TaxID=304850 RepID=UPI003FD19B22
MDLRREKTSMPWLTESSPLRHPQSLPSHRDMQDRHRDMLSLEKGFVVDAVITSVNASFPRRPVIPPYDAMKDKYASSYFRSPTVQAMLDREKTRREIKTEQNKLSTRRRCKATPTADDLRRRRDRFVVDAIEVERRRDRNRFYDIIPPYTADQDHHCKGYFQRSDIKKLLSVTLASPRS